MKRLSYRISIRSCIVSAILVLVAVMTTGCAANNLIDAAKGNQSDRIVELISKGADINAVDSTGYTALHWAAYNGNLNAAKALAEHGAKIDARDSDQGTPMFDAIVNRHANVAKYLLDKGADINASDKNGWTALMWAACNRDSEAAEMLIAHDADVNFHVAGKPTALAVAHDYAAGNVENVLKKHGAKF